MPICVECSAAIDDLVVSEHKHTVLAKCPYCNSPVDCYLENDNVQCFLSMQLLHIGSFRHVIFNIPRSGVTLAVAVLVTCLLEAYAVCIVTAIVALLRERLSFVTPNGMVVPSLSFSSSSSLSADTPLAIPTPSSSSARAAGPSATLAASPAATPADSPSVASATTTVSPSSPSTTTTYNSSSSYFAAPSSLQTIASLAASVSASIGETVIVAAYNASMRSTSSRNSNKSSSNISMLSLSLPSPSLTPATTTGRYGDGDRRLSSSSPAGERNSYKRSPLASTKVDLASGRSTTTNAAAEAAAAAATVTAAHQQHQQQQQQQQQRTQEQQERELQQQQQDLQSLLETPNIQLVSMVTYFRQQQPYLYHYLCRLPLFFLYSLAEVFFVGIITVWAGSQFIERRRRYPTPAASNWMTPAAAGGVDAADGAQWQKQPLKGSSSSIHRNRSSSSSSSSNSSSSSSEKKQRRQQQRSSSRRSSSTSSSSVSSSSPGTPLRRVSGGDSDNDESVASSSSLASSVESNTSTTSSATTTPLRGSRSSNSSSIGSTPGSPGSTDSGVSEGSSSLGDVGVGGSGSISSNSTAAASGGSSASATKPTATTTSTTSTTSTAWNVTVALAKAEALSICTRAMYILFLIWRVPLSLIFVIEVSSLGWLMCALRATRTSRVGAVMVLALAVVARCSFRLATQWAPLTIWWEGSLLTLVAGPALQQASGANGGGGV